MFDTEKYVVPNRLNGFIKHVEDHNWEVLGGDHVANRFFVFKIHHPKYPFTLDSLGGYYGLGPAKSANYHDATAWSVPVQMKK